MLYVFAIINSNNLFLFSWLKNLRKNKQTNWLKLLKTIHLLDEVYITFIYADNFLAQ